MIKSLLFIPLIRWLPIFVIGLLSHICYADSESYESKQHKETITEILDGEEFNQKKTLSGWRLKDIEEDKGGFLIAGVNTEDTLKDSILQRFGLQTIENIVDDSWESDFLNNNEEPPKLSDILKEMNEEANKEENNTKDGNEDESNSNNSSDINLTNLFERKVPKTAVTISFEDSNDELTVFFPDELALEFTEYSDINESMYTTGNNFGIHLAQTNYGDGILTILSHSSIWESRNIGNNDNAYLLASFIDETNPFNMIYNVRRESLWQLLKKYGFETIAVTAFLIFIWLWHKIVRTGRILAPPSRNRRAFTDHVMAVSEFHMAENNQHLLLNAVKNAIFDELLKRDHRFDQYDTNVQAGFIAEWCSLNEKSVHQWLLFFDEPNNNQLAFIQQMQMANTIRKQL
jgi:hypothetical protein